MSYYTAMMIIKCSLKTNKKRYEDIALSLYGAKVGRVTFIINIICLLSFDFAYISYYKSVIPKLISFYANKTEDPNSIPDWIRDTNQGQIFWGLFYSFLVLFPMSIPRKVSDLKFISIFGVFCELCLTLVVITVFMTDKELVPSPSENP